MSVGRAAGLKDVKVVGIFTDAYGDEICDSSCETVEISAGVRTALEISGDFRFGDLRLVSMIAECARAYRYER